MNSDWNQEKSKLDPYRWVNTMWNQEKSKLDPYRWVNTLPSYSIQNSHIPTKKYFIGVLLFVFGLIFVSVIKNETRNLQKEISALKKSNNVLKFNLSQATLDHEVISSPENISRLAKEYLESELIPYNKYQIKHIDEKELILTRFEKTESEKFFQHKKSKYTDKGKLKVAKKIEIKKKELKKLQENYSKPKKLPTNIKLRVTEKIETKKSELKKLYSNPYELIKSKKTQKWIGLQVVKVFLGIPIVPGR